MKKVHLRLSILLVLGICLFCSGCETARGFSKDVKNTWRNLTGADNWFKENLW